MGHLKLRNNVEKHVSDINGQMTSEKYLLKKVVVNLCAPHAWLLGLCAIYSRSQPKIPLYHFSSGQLLQLAQLASFIGRYKTQRGLSSVPSRKANCQFVHRICTEHNLKIDGHLAGLTRKIPFVCHLWHWLLKKNIHSAAKHQHKIKIMYTCLYKYVHCHCNNCFLSPILKTKSVSCSAQKYQDAPCHSCSCLHLFTTATSWKFISSQQFTNSHDFTGFTIVNWKRTPTLLRQTYQYI